MCIITLPDTRFSTQKSSSLRGRPNIKAIHPYIEKCGKRSWYERKFSKTRLAVPKKCFKKIYEWQSYSSGQKSVTVPQIRGCWIGDSLTKEEVLLSSSYYRVFPAIYFSCYLHLSACSNLNCYWFGIKFKFCQTIVDRGVQFNISGPDSLNSIAVLIGK